MGTSMTGGSTTATGSAGKEQRRSMSALFTNTKPVGKSSSYSRTTRETSRETPKQMTARL